MTTSERIARALIAKRNLNDLLGDWEATTTNNDENIDIVRGWPGKGRRDSGGGLGDVLRRYNSPQLL